MNVRDGGHGMGVEIHKDAFCRYKRKKKEKEMRVYISPRGFGHIP